MKTRKFESAEETKAVAGDISASTDTQDYELSIPLREKVADTLTQGASEDKKVFISHAGDGGVKSGWALPIGESLDILGVSNFVDHRHLGHGARADAKMKRQLYTAKAIIILLDHHHFFESTYCLQELNIAIERERNEECRIFPVFLSDIKRIKEKAQEKGQSTAFLRITGWEEQKDKQVRPETIAVSVAHYFEHGEGLNSDTIATLDTAKELWDKLKGGNFHAGYYMYICIQAPPVAMGRSASHFLFQQRIEAELVEMSKVDPYMDRGLIIRKKRSEDSAISPYPIYCTKWDRDVKSDLERGKIHSLVWCSYGFGPDEGEQLRIALSKNIPCIVVLIYKYGAKQAAEFLRDFKNFPQDTVIVYIAADVSNEDGRRVLSETVFPLVNRLSEQQQCSRNAQDLFEVLRDLVESVNLDSSGPIDKKDCFGLFFCKDEEWSCPIWRPDPVLGDTTPTINSSPPKSNMFDEESGVLQCAVDHDGQMRIVDVPVAQDLAKHICQWGRKCHQVILIGATQTRTFAQAIVLEVCAAAVIGCPVDFTNQASANTCTLDLNDEFTGEKAWHKFTHVYCAFENADVDAILDALNESSKERHLLLWLSLEKDDDLLDRLGTIFKKVRSCLVLATGDVNETRAHLDRMSQSQTTKPGAKKITIEDEKCLEEPSFSNSAVVADLHKEIILWSKDNELVEFCNIKPDLVKQALKNCLALSTEPAALFTGERMIAARICVTDIGLLYKLREAVLTGDFSTSFETSLPEQDFSKHVDIDLTQFAEMYEQAVLQLEQLTPHQERRLAECRDSPRTLLDAPAGAGKTFLALHLMLETITKESDKKVLFASSNPALGFFIARWILERRHAKSPCEAGSILERIHILFIKGDSLSLNELVLIDDGLLEFSKDVIAEDSCSYALVVVDEAHFIFSQETLRVRIEQFAKRNKTRVLLLSDTSQAETTNIDYGHVKSVQLTEVIRCSERIVKASTCFQSGGKTNRDSTKSSHSVRGPPLRSYLFDSCTTNAQRENQYVSNILKAFKRLGEDFPGLSFDNRIAIIAPGKTIVEQIRYKLAEKLKSTFPNRTFELVNATQACAVVCQKGKQERIVLDEIAHFDGLESLIVFCVGLDSPISDRTVEKGRSMLYRGLTRAHMLVCVINERISNGWLEFLTRIELKSSSDDDLQQQNVNAAASLTPSLPDLSSRSKQLRDQILVNLERLGFPELSKAEIGILDKSTSAAQEKDARDMALSLADELIPARFHDFAQQQGLKVPLSHDDNLLSCIRLDLRSGMEFPDACAAALSLAQQIDTLLRDCRDISWTRNEHTLALPVARNIVLGRLISESLNALDAIAGANGNANMMTKMRRKVANFALRKKPVSQCRKIENCLKLKQGPSSSSLAAIFAGYCKLFAAVWEQCDADETFDPTIFVDQCKQLLSRAGRSFEVYDRFAYLYLRVPRLVRKRLGEKPLIVPLNTAEIDLITKQTQERVGHDEQLHKACDDVFGRWVDKRDEILGRLHALADKRKFTRTNYLHHAQQEILGELAKMHEHEQTGLKPETCSCIDQTGLKPETNISVNRILLQQQVLAALNAANATKKRFSKEVFEELVKELSQQENLSQPSLRERAKELARTKPELNIHQQSIWDTDGNQTTWRDTDLSFDPFLLNFASVKQVFISHAGAEGDTNNFARPMREYLKTLEISSFVDHGDLKPGDKVDQIMEYQLKKAQVVVFYLNRAFFESWYCRKELEIAIKQMNMDKCAVVPVFGADMSELKDLAKKHKMQDTWKELGRTTGWEFQKDKNVTPRTIAIAVAHYFYKGEFLNSSTYASDESGAVKTLEYMLEKGGNVLEADDAINPKAMADNKMKGFDPVFRTWVFDRIKEWCFTSGEWSRAFVLKGNAGMGKSVISSMLFTESSILEEENKSRCKVTIGAAHFFNFERSDSSDLFQVFLSIANQLAKHVQGLATQLFDNVVAKIDSIKQDSAEKQFKALIADPCTNVRPDNERTIIVFDALDECDPSVRIDLLRILQRDFKKHCPSWLGFFLTTRSDEYDEVIKDFHPTELDAEKEKNLDDLRVYFENKLKKCVRDDDFKKAVDILTRRSDGLFLYARFANETIDRLNKKSRGGLISLEQIQDEDNFATS